MAIRVKKLKAKEQLSEMHDYLHDRPLPNNFYSFILENDLHNNTEELWRLHSEVIIAEHVKENPGTRPKLFWKFDAPRLPIGTFPGCYYDGQLPEPRKRLGGTGTPAREVQAVVPAFAYGLPTAWVGIDSDDPPVFESQAAYLKRHGLLLAGEERRSDFAPETIPL